MSQGDAADPVEGAPVRAAQSLREAFEQAAALPAAERAGWLESCVADPETRAQLRAMLAFGSDRPSVLDQTAATLIVRLDEAEADVARLIGSCMGPFRLDAVLGEGGSSVVFRAHRQIGDGQQIVALKLLRTGLKTPEAQRRFRREQGMLTRLNHPNLAGLIDGGIDASGIPYIAMEWVDGLPITEHARRHALPLRARLALMCEVCRAVDAAHRALIVHRDLKPSNVLVTRGGQAKVLDFGIALLLDEWDATAAQPEDRALSPGYAAPEQYRAEPITRATDVYSLGVILAEMLTGRRWSEIEGPLSSSVRAAVGATGLPPPRELARALRGDLDTIVARATAALPEQRYRSADALANDIQCYVEQRPITARASSNVYRVTRFVQRHALATGFLVVVGIALIAAAWAVIVESREARQQATRALMVRDFLVSLFESAKEETPRDQRPTPDVLVRRAAERIRGNAALAAATRFELLRTLGEVSVANGDYADAERLYRDAADVGRMIFRPDHTEVLDIELLRATLLLRLTRYREAADAYEAWWPQILETDTAAKAEALLNYPSALMFSARVDEALAIAPEAASLAARFHGPGTAKGRAALVMPPSMLIGAGRYREAIPAFEALMPGWRNGTIAPGPAYVEAIRGLAAARTAIGDLAAADALTREGVDVARRIYEPPHDWLARALLDRGRDLILRERLAEAEPLLAEALKMFESVYGPGHLRIANVMQAFGDLALKRRQYGRALEHLRSAREWCEKPGLPPTRTCATTDHKLAEAYLGSGRIDDARRHNDRAYETATALFAHDHLYTAKILRQHGAIALARGDAKEALATCEAALAMLARMGQEAGDTAVLARYLRAKALEASGDDRAALQDIERALAGQGRLVPDSRLRAAEMLMYKSVLEAKLGATDAASETAREVSSLGANRSDVDGAVWVRFEAMPRR